MMHFSKPVSGIALAAILNAVGAFADARAQALDPLSHDAYGDFDEFVLSVSSSAASSASVSLFEIQETTTGDVIAVGGPQAIVSHAVEVTAASSGSVILR